MRVIAKKRLREFWERHPAAREPLLAWFREVEREDWGTPAAVEAKYRNASIPGDDRVVFNVKGNAYRVVVRIKYAYRIVYVRFVGTNAEYDAVDAKRCKDGRHRADSDRSGLRNRAGADRRADERRARQPGRP